ncbi:MAG TPA: hypothetical protein VKV39_05595 [Candidatus Sulfotelmatobacter sp.]|nr:hypothetical protein [Candidatus Sulfotelmatobacter sp.]
MNKKLVVNGVAMALLMLGTALGSGYGQSTTPACNDRLITGSYGFTIQGSKLSGQGAAAPQVGVAMTAFDGKGGLTQIDTVTVNGEVVADFTHSPATGTYTVNSDCTGSFTINFTDGRPPVAANFVVVESGSEIDTVVVSAGGNQGIIATGSVGKRRFCKR